MTRRHAFLVTLLALLAFAGVTARRCAAACLPLSPAQLALSADYVIPEGEPEAMILELPDYGVVDFPPRGGALVTLQVLPPQLDLPEDVFVVGEDYSGCIDAESGSGQIDFQRAGPYFVRAGYADGHVDHFEVFVIAIPSIDAAPTVSAGGGWIQMPAPSGAQGYRGGGKFGNDPTGYNTQTSLDGLISQIKADYGNAGGKIDIALRYHGAPGEFTIQKGEWISLGPKGKANFDKFCQAARNRVKSITLQTCRTGLGPKGCEFLQALSACAGGVPVYASTGKVTTTWKKNNPSGTVKTVTKGTVVSNANCQ
jgi:hypothetical protein